MHLRQSSPNRHVEILGDLLETHLTVMSHHYYFAVYFGQLVQSLLELVLQLGELHRFIRRRFGRRQLARHVVPLVVCRIKRQVYRTPLQSPDTIPSEIGGYPKEPVFESSPMFVISYFLDESDEHLLQQVLGIMRCAGGPQEVGVKSLPVSFQQLVEGLGSALAALLDDVYQRILFLHFRSLSV